MFKLLFCEIYHVFLTRKALWG